MYKVTLERISNGVALRTDSVVGYCLDLPLEGKSFQMFGQGLTSDQHTRMITTSTVQTIEQTLNTYLLKTQNSVYHLTVEETQD